MATLFNTFLLLFICTVKTSSCFRIHTYKSIQMTQQVWIFYEHDQYIYASKNGMIYRFSMRRYTGYAHRKSRLAVSYNHYCQSELNSFPAKLSHLNFHPLEVVSRQRDPQLEVVKKYSFSFNLRANICKSCCLNTHFIPNCDLTF